jgi:hypothetical protein
VIVRLAVVAGLVATTLARADTPRPQPPAAAAPASEPADPAADEAGDANLESTADRTGMTLAVAVGAGLIAGFGIEDSVGRGGALSLRLGRVATPHTVITFEFDGAAALHKPTMNASTETNSNVDLLAGAQYYASPSLWLRAGAGVGIYQARGVLLTGDRTTIGPAVLGAIGVDIARLKWAVFGIEAGTSAMINNGVLFGSSLKLGLAFD